MKSGSGEIHFPFFIDIFRTSYVRNKFDFSKNLWYNFSIKKKENLILPKIREEKIMTNYNLLTVYISKNVQDREYHVFTEDRMINDIYPFSTNLFDIMNEIKNDFENDSRSVTFVVTGGF